MFAASGAGRARPFEGWPCYHTALDTFTLAGQTVGIVGSVVGAPFAVLVAEELFASGCRFLLSLTSAGQITPAGPPPYFVIIDRALRDEGTSYHYAAPSAYGEADTRLVATAVDVLKEESDRMPWSARAGPRMLHFAKPPRRSKPLDRKACWRSKWKQPPSTRLLAQQVQKFSASPTSRMPWAGWNKTLKRARRTEPPMLYKFSKQLFEQVQTSYRT